MNVFKNFLVPKIDFKRDIIRARIWFPYGKRLLANNMTGQADIKLCKLGGGWLLVKQMYQELFFPSRAKEAKNQKEKKNAWSQVRPIRAQKARSHMGHGCLGASVEMELGCSGFAAVSFLCTSVVRRFSAARAQVVTLFATPSWTVQGKRLLNTGVDVQVLKGLLEAVFESRVFFVSWAKREPDSITSHEPSTSQPWVKPIR